MVLRAVLPALGLRFGLALGLFGLPVDAAAQLAGHGGPVRGVAVAPDGDRVVTASFDYSVILWSLERREATAKISSTGNSNSSRTASISRPTLPVAPTTARR